MPKTLAQMAQIESHVYHICIKNKFTFRFRKLVHNEIKKAVHF